MLILPIKKKWYDMILSGEKKEEYREIKQYYRSRFENLELLDVYGLPRVAEALIRFRNGYGSDCPSFTALCSLDIRGGKTEWGAEPNKQYYVLKILKIEEIK